MKNSEKENLKKSSKEKSRDDKETKVKNISTTKDKENKSKEVKSKKKVKAKIKEILEDEDDESLESEDEIEDEDDEDSPKKISLPKKKEVKSKKSSKDKVKAALEEDEDEIEDKDEEDEDEDSPKKISGVKSKKPKEVKLKKKGKDKLKAASEEEGEEIDEVKPNKIPESQKMNDLVKEVISKRIEDGYILLIEELKDFVYDEDVAEKLGIKTTIIRKWLNELHTDSLVEYSRTKNKKTGWYVYLWKVREDKILEFTRGILTKEIENLNSEIENESGANFRCSCSSYRISEAMEFNFECPKCKSKIEKSELSEDTGNKRKLIEDAYEKIKKLKQIKTVF